MSGIFGQLKPAIATWEDLYTAPANVEETLRVIIANLGSSNTTFRVAVSKGGAPILDEHRITGGDEPILANVSGSTIGFVITSTDVIRVFSGNGDVAFTATGTTRDTS